MLFLDWHSYQANLLDKQEKNYQLSSLVSHTDSFAIHHKHVFHSDLRFCLSTFHQGQMIKEQRLETVKRILSWHSTIRMWEHQTNGKDKMWSRDTLVLDCQCDIEYIELIMSEHLTGLMSNLRQQKTIGITRKLVMQQKQN